MIDKQFLAGCAERALKTFVQTFVAVLGVSAGVVYTADSARSLPWLSAVITALFSAVLSVVTSLGSTDFVAGRAPQQPVESSPVVSPTVTVPDDITGLVEPDGDDTDDTVYEPQRAE